VIVLLFGAPGTGKSTYARYLAEKTGSTWISTGGLLREKSQQDPEIKQTLESGRLVPDDEVDRILFDRLRQLECSFVLDGYPRTLQQMDSFLKFLDGLGCRVGKIFHLSVPVEVVVSRMMSRGRADDTPETVKHRFEVFERETKDVIDSFEKSGVSVTEIDNTPSVDQVKKEFDKSLQS
jgi:adenylate kinase